MNCRFFCYRVDQHCHTLFGCTPDRNSFSEVEHLKKCASCGTHLVAGVRVGAGGGVTVSFSHGKVLVVSSAYVELTLITCSQIDSISR